MADKTAEKTEAHTHNAARPGTTGDNPVHASQAPVTTASPSTMPAPSTPHAGPGGEIKPPDAPKRVPAKPVHERFFRLLESAQTSYHATLFADVLPEDVVQRDFWVEVVQKLSPGCKITVITEDKSWYGEMLVWASGNNWAEARFLPGYPIFPPSGLAVVGNDYALQERGLIKKWAVISLVDGREVSVGNLTREAAANWLAEYLRMQGGRRAA